MSRPHEDRERHTLVDHQAGGLPITLTLDTRCAIDLLHVRADRAEAAIAAYETLVEKARATWSGVGGGAVLCSYDRRRVIVLVQVAGDDEFRRLAAAWDEHHLLQEKRAVDESRSLALYRVRAAAGDGLIEAASSEAFAFERLALAPDRAGAIVPAAQAAPGFAGLTLFGADDDSASAIIYRFLHKEQIAAFRASAEAVAALGPIEGSGDVEMGMHVIRTFA